jgi:hypothetical protein
MPTTADKMVAAARLNFGRARDDRAMELMRRWLNAGCRDWRRETDGVAADEAVVSAVFAKPIKAQHLRMQIANNVKRWGFLRRERATTNLRFLTIDEYMQNPTGELVQRRARELIHGAAQKAVERMDFIDRIRHQRQEEKLKAFRAKQLQRHAPVLKLALKGLWTYASMNFGKLREKKGWTSFRQDPVKRRRRITRHLDYEDLEKYDEEGEPIWARIDVRR